MPWLPPTAEEERQSDRAEAQRPDDTGRHHQEDVPTGQAARRRVVGRQPQSVVTRQRTLGGRLETRELLGPVHLECPLTRR